MTEPCAICGGPDARYVADPYELEVNEELFHSWLCEGCEQERRDDI